MILLEIEVKDSLTHFQSMFRFYIPENIIKLWFFYVFRRYRSGALVKNGLHLLTPLHQPSYSTSVPTLPFQKFITKLIWMQHFWFKRKFTSRIMAFVELLVVAGFRQKFSSLCLSTMFMLFTFTKISPFAWDLIVNFIPVELKNSRDSLIAINFSYSKIQRNEWCFRSNKNRA